MEKLLTVKEVAEMLALSKYAIYGMVVNNAIPYVKIGRTNRSVRFDRQKIDFWIKNKSCDKILEKEK